MVAQVVAPQKGKTIFLTLQELPAFQENVKECTIHQIAAYFRRLLEGYQEPMPPYVLLPPALELAYFFQCPELYIFEALQLLKQQAFDYQVRGWDGPITLRDPLGRKRVNQHRHNRFIGVFKQYPMTEEA